MVRRWLIIIFLLLVGTVSAQGAVWAVWVYDADSGQAVLVDNTSAVLYNLTLPVPAEYPTGSYDYSRGLAVSRDGTRLAYRVSGFNATGAPLATVMVYDVASSEVLMHYNPPISPNADSFDVVANPRLFSDNGGALAYAFATGDDDTSQAWQLVVLDTFSGAIVAQLGSRDSAIANQEFELRNAPYLMPSIHNYAGTVLDFTLFPYYTGMNLPTDSFQWNVITGRVTLAQRFPTITSDYLPQTSEAIMPVLDERVAYDTNYAPYLNAVHVFRPELGGRVPFYATTSLDVFDVYFVQGGERVLIVGESLTDFTKIWLLIDRNGTSRSMPALQAEGDYVRGTPDGFVYTLSGDFPVVIAANTRTENIDQNAIWTGTPNSHFVPVWVSPMPHDGAYDAWAQLAAPVFAAEILLVPENDTSGGITPNQVPTPQLNPSGVLTVQGVAIINTTDGDRLNMRSSPALSSDVIARVESGSRVVILDGPVAADGYVWWQVRLSTGLAGWVVESADSVDTLIPAG